MKNVGRQARYIKYLRSRRWMRIRKRAIERAEYRCQVCNGTEKLEVHHRTYENLGHEHAMDIIVLCDECHTLFHTHGKIK